MCRVSESNGAQPEQPKFKMDAHYSKHAAELKAAKGKVEEKWNRRGRSPLKFVESFDELEDLVSYHESSLKEPDAEGIPEEFISFIRKMRSSSNRVGPITRQSCISRMLSVQRMNIGETGLIHQ